MKHPEINPYATRRVAASLKRTMQSGTSSILGCCINADNLLPEDASDLHLTAMFRCRVCHRGHRYMIAETGALGCSFK